MSYILDALRKSEQQRQQAKAPLLYTAQLSTGTGKQPPLLLYGMAAGILVCLAGLAGWLRPWQQGEADKAAIHAGTTEPRLHLAESLPSALLEPAGSEKPARSSPVPAPAATATSLPERGEKKPGPDAAASFKEGAPRLALALPRQTRASEESPAPAARHDLPPRTKAAMEGEPNESAREQKIVAIYELPRSIQQEIPDMSISGYVDSSTPGGRTVGINNRLLQEGDYLSPGLKLEQISQDGLVFSYKKYRFRQGLH